jgi:RHS repeat-associated protein
VLYCYDAHGNVTELIDAYSGAVVARYRYGVFGGTVRAEGPLAAANPWRFATRYHDDETGLIIFPRRPYTPQLGRFLSRDPIEESGGLNLYAITKNNPVSNVDPFGTEIYEGELFRLIVDSEPLYLDDAAFDRIEPSPGIIGLFYPDPSKRKNVDGNGKFWDWSGANCHGRTDGRTRGMIVTEKATEYYIKKIRKRAKGHPYPVSGTIEQHESTHYQNAVAFWLAYEAEIRSFRSKCVCAKCTGPIDSYLGYRYSALLWKMFSKQDELDTTDYGAIDQASNDNQKEVFFEQRARRIHDRYPECF